MCPEEKVKLRGLTELPVVGLTGAGCIEKMRGNFMEKYFDDS